jgi:hypothetical protein
MLIQMARARAQNLKIIRNDKQGKRNLTVCINVLHYTIAIF